VNVGPYHQQRLFEAADEEIKPRVVVDHDGLVTYDPYYLDPWFADGAFEELRSNVPWRQDELKMYGRTIPIPRLTAWYGDPGATYVYSGIRNEPMPWNSVLEGLRQSLEASHGVRFNSVLLNLYRNGRDSLSWHADDERELGREPFIASLSLGATRIFQMQHRVSGETRSIDLEHGSLLVMSGVTQQYWKHQVPKERDATGARINLTFRVIDAVANDGDRVRENPRARHSRQESSRR
jgi:alkylated DNA repair dioxygenase AlkB